MKILRGREFLHTPGPTNMPDQVLKAMARPAIDHRGDEFQVLAQRCFASLRDIFKTKYPVLVYPSVGHGAWEAALVNTCSPGNKVLMAETGTFSEQWKKMAEDLGLSVLYLPGDWRHGPNPDTVFDQLNQDKGHEIKAVAIVHNETSTGVTTRLSEIRSAIDAANHPALFLVDTISSLASINFCMDEWKVDVAVGGSQKGLMLPPGLSFNGISEKAWSFSQSAQLPRRYWDWKAMMPDGKTPGFLSTPATNMFFGLQASIQMIEEEGLTNVFDRHARLAGAVRNAISHWAEAGGLELISEDPREHSNTVSAILLTKGHDADTLRADCKYSSNVALAAGLGQFSGKAFRIGHLGDLNEPMILGTLAAVEIALKKQGIPYQSGGTTAAIDYLS